MDNKDTFKLRQPNVADDRVIEFIANMRYSLFKNGSADLSKFFLGDYQFYFAAILKVAFGRGDIRFDIDTETIVWYDTDHNVSYNYDGVFLTNHTPVNLSFAKEAGIVYKLVPKPAPTTVQLKATKRYTTPGFYPEHGSFIPWSKLLYRNIIEVDSTGMLYTSDFSCLPNGALCLSSEVKAIASNAFYNMKNLTDVVIPNTVTCIERKAFSGSNLLQISIPSSVQCIGTDAFSDIDVVYYSGDALGAPWGAKSIVAENPKFNVVAYLKNKLGTVFDDLPRAAINDCETQKDCDLLISTLSRFIPN